MSFGLALLFCRVRSLICYNHPNQKDAFPPFILPATSRYPSSHVLQFLQFISKHPFRDREQNFQPPLVFLVFATFGRKAAGAARLPRRSAGRRRVAPGRRFGLRVKRRSEESELESGFWDILTCHEGHSKEFGGPEMKTRTLASG